MSHGGWVPCHKEERVRGCIQCCTTCMWIRWLRTFLTPSHWRGRVWEHPLDVGEPVPGPFTVLLCLKDIVRLLLLCPFKASYRFSLEWSLKLIFYSIIPLHELEYSKGQIFKSMRQPQFQPEWQEVIRHQNKWSDSSKELSTLPHYQYRGGLNNLLCFGWFMAVLWGDNIVAVLTQWAKFSSWVAPLHCLCMKNWLGLGSMQSNPLTIFCRTHVSGFEIFQIVQHVALRLLDPSGNLRRAQVVTFSASGC